MTSNASYSIWRACLLGALNGLVIGCTAEVIRQAHGDYQNRFMVADFESQGMSPPLMVDMIRWWAIPFTVTIAFIIVAVFVHRFWAARLKSCLLIWEIIGVGGVIVSGILWQPILATGPPDGSFSIIRDIRRLQSGYTLSDLMVYGSFLRDWVVLLLLAMVINLFYDGFIQISAKLYGAKRASRTAT